MTRRQFANAKHKALYDAFRRDPPSAGFGGGNAAAYRFGFANPMKPAKHVRGSTAYAAWAAGVDAYRAKVDAEETAAMLARAVPYRP